MTAPIYTLRNIVQTYNGRTVLNIERLTIKQGEVLALVGPSGAGKSTLLRLLAFLERPSSGKIEYKERLCDGDWPDLETRRGVAMVFQRPQLLRRSVRDNVAYGLRLRGLTDKNGEITTILEQLGLLPIATASAETLSGGEMQRVALARTLILKPSVLLLDEPTANLDPLNIKLIETIVGDANKTSGVTAVIVTHNIYQAQRLARRVALLIDGRLVEIAPTDDFFQRPKQPQTAAFTRGDIIY